MTIKEVEEQSGLARSNIRFYEKENLIHPKRNTNNGYRDYSEKDVGDIKKIAFLRTLGVPVEDIRKIIEKEIALQDVIKQQSRMLESQMTELRQAKNMCKKILSQGDIRYEEWDVEQYAPDLKQHWSENNGIFQTDSVSFLSLWGGMLVWGILTFLCLAVALFTFYRLPSEIPLQWSEGRAVRQVDKIFIFAYPLACVIFRFFLRPFVWRWLQLKGFYGDAPANYLTNFLCFVALSVETFTIL